VNVNVWYCLTGKWAVVDPYAHRLGGIRGKNYVHQLPEVATLVLIELAQSADVAAGYD
jgi:hypothetical protein